MANPNTVSFPVTDGNICNSAPDKDEEFCVHAFE